MVLLDGETLLDRAVRTVREAGCSPVVVLLGADADRIRRGCGLDGATIVINHDWTSGMASSIVLGVDAVGDADGLVLMTCDQPAVSAKHLRALIGAETAASVYAGRRGVPAYFPRSAFAGLRELRGDRGARDLVVEARVVELSLGELDVDTPEDMARAERLFG